MLSFSLLILYVINTEIDVSFKYSMKITFDWSEQSKIPTQLLSDESETS